MPIIKFTMEKIVPAFNEKNWVHCASFKFERVGGFNGKWSTTAPAGHWTRNTPLQPFGVGEDMFFIDTEHPDEVVRLIGAGAHEYVAYLFRKKSAKKKGV